MAKYIPYDYNRSVVVVINYLDQLQPGTFEHAKLNDHRHLCQ